MSSKTQLRRLRAFAWPLTAAIAATLMILRVAHAGELHCEPKVVYRGESFVVDLPSHHEGYDLAIDRRDGDELLMTFNADPRDTLQPVIPPAGFARLKQITILTTDARGQLSRSSLRQVPQPLGPAEKIFTKSGRYLVLVSPALDVCDGPEFDACWINYINHDRARPNARAVTPADAKFP